MKLIQIIFLYPLTIIYSSITTLRNYLYDSKTLKSTKFDLPLITIGNLSTGGTGKTPHTDYLIRLLKNEFNTAVLSRGYGRKTSGYIEASSTSTAKNIGDEPLFYKLKHPYTKVAVCEDRIFGISKMAQNEELRTVYLLDDAFQHRAIRAGLSIIISDYNQRYTKDYVLPYGNLRETKKGASRADIIVISKCPPLLSEQEKNEIIAEIKPKEYQYVFFSAMKYFELYPVFIQNKIVKESKTTALVVSGIANPKPLEQEIESRFKKVYTRIFSDHHNFTLSDIQSIIRTYDNLEEDNKVIITTEKDLTRLLEFKDLFIEANVKIFCLPIIVNFSDDDEKERFNKLIRHYLSITLPPIIEEENIIEHDR